MNCILRNTFELACVWKSFVLNFRLARCHTSHSLRYMLFCVLFFTSTYTHSLLSFSLLFTNVQTFSMSWFQYMDSVVCSPSVELTATFSNETKETMCKMDRARKQKEAKKEQKMKMKKTQQRFETGDYMNFSFVKFLRNL